MSASNHALGVTVSLPEGTSSVMERRRAEELRRRQQQPGPEQPQGAAHARRLAPQRKKKIPAPVAADVAGERLPLDVSGANDGGDDGADAILFDETQEGGGLTRRVADWTLREAREAALKAANASDEVKSEAEQGGEYHGEIESVASDDGDNQGISAMSEADNNEEEDDIFHIATEHDISLDPPCRTSPLVLVNLASLCGCRPEDYNEKQLMERQLLRAVLGPREQQEDGSDETNEGNADEALEGLDFDERAVELFESGAGRHADTSHPIAVAVAAEGPHNDENDAVSPYASLSYPEFLTERHFNTPRSTARMWKVLHTTPTNDPQLSPLLSRIFAHLRNTSRSLLWKADMHHELSQLARREYLLQKRRTQQKEYNDWKESTRGQRLERLYDVRETFQVQVDAARKKYEAFVLEREERVERELRRRGLVGLRSGAHKSNTVLGGFPGRGAEDAGEREEEYDEDGWGGNIQEDDIIGEERDGDTHRFDLPYEDDEDETDEWSPLHTDANPLGMDLVLEGVPGTVPPPDRDEHVAPVPNPAPHRLEPISHDDNLHRISQRQQQKKKEQQSPAAPSQRDDHLRSQEEAVRAMLKTNDERIAHATWLTLERRLKGVDELLEKLQEEEWAEEEDEEEGGTTMGRGGPADADAADESGTTNLLDQILAMILGMLPKQDEETTDEAHYRYVKGEHDAIVKEWMAAFGRLPPFPAAEAATEQETEERGDALPFGDGFAPSGSKLRPGRAGEGGGGLGETKKALRLVGNEDGNWDDVEDWDAVFPGV